jgi:hypothetical protein
MYGLVGAGAKHKVLEQIIRTRPGEEGRAKVYGDKVGQEAGLDLSLGRARGRAAIVHPTPCGVIIE